MKISQALVVAAIAVVALFSVASAAPGKKEVLPLLSPAF
jgi:hypothetical protein